MKFKRWHIIPGVLGLLIFISFIRVIYVMVTDDRVFLTKPVPAHEMLFTQEAKQKLKFFNGSKGKDRQPYSSYLYDGKYEISIYGVKLNNDLDISKIIQYKNIRSGKMDGVYGKGGDSKFKIKVTSKHIPTASVLHFEFYGSSLKSFFEKDNLFYGYLIYDTFATRYDNNSYYLIAEATQEERPASIAFLKQDKILYTIIMTPWDNGDELPEDLLYRIIQKP